MTVAVAALRRNATARRMPLPCHLSWLLLQRHRIVLSNVSAFAAAESGSLGSTAVLQWRESAAVARNTAGMDRPLIGGLTTSL